MKIKFLLLSLLIFTHITYAKTPTNAKECSVEIKKIDVLFQKASEKNKSETPTQEQLRIAEQGISLCSIGCGDGCYFFMQDSEKGTKEGCAAKYASEGACLDILMESLRVSEQKSFDIPIAKKLCKMKNKIACSLLHPEKMSTILGPETKVERIE